MKTKDYQRLREDIALLEDIAKEYPGKTIDNIIVQLKARRLELWQQEGLLDPPKQYIYGPRYIKRM